MFNIKEFFIADNDTNFMDEYYNYYECIDIIQTVNRNLTFTIQNKRNITKKNSIKNKKYNILSDINTIKVVNMKQKKRKMLKYSDFYNLNIRKA